jgi:hypothetical protein
MKADHPVGTGHGAGSTVDAAVRIDQYRAGAGYPVDGTCQTGGLAGCGLAVATAVGETLVKTACTHMDARFRPRPFQRRANQCAVARVGRSTGQHALHAAHTPFRMNNDLIHGSSFMIRVIQGKGLKQLAKIKSGPQQPFGGQTQRSAVLNQGAEHPTLFDIADQHRPNQPILF